MKSRNTKKPKAFDSKKALKEIQSLIYQWVTSDAEGRCDAGDSDYYLEQIMEAAGRKAGFCTECSSFRYLNVPCHCGQA